MSRDDNNLTATDLRDVTNLLETAENIVDGLAGELMLDSIVLRAAWTDVYFLVELDSNGDWSMRPGTVTVTVDD